MSQPILKVTGLKKAYGAIQAVGGVSFEVMPGEIFGVIRQDDIVQFHARADHARRRHH
jgi:ABC-type branched-subunit amino acid transport system ATPase component